MNRKQVIRINENQLKQIVMESVKKVLNEHNPLYTNGDKEIPIGSHSQDAYVYHYDNDGNRVVHDWGKDIRDKHNKRIWKYEKPTSQLERDKKELLPMLRELGITVKDWIRMSPEEKQDAVNYYEGFNDSSYGEGREGFEYLSNPSSLPAGWQ